MNPAFDCNSVYENLTYDVAKRLEGKNIFLTGASGFIGQSIIYFFNFLNENILNSPCSLLCSEHNSKVEESDFVEVIKVDLKSPLSESMAGRNINYIMHAAGIVSPQEYGAYPLEVLELSYLGTKNILDAAKNLNVDSVLCFSSSAVYGESCKVPLHEDDCYAISPFSDRAPYVMGKKILEILCFLYHSREGVPVKIVRPFNIYGPRMGNENVIMKFINNILSDKDINIFGDGRQTRTFCHIGDALNGFLRVMILGQNGETYNIGSDKSSETSISELAALLLKISNKSINIELSGYPENYPKNEPKRSMPDIRKSAEEVGFYNSTGLEKGISELYNLCEKNFNLKNNKSLRGD